MLREKKEKIHNTNEALTCYRNRPSSSCSWLNASCTWLAAASIGGLPASCSWLAAANVGGLADSIVRLAALRERTTQQQQRQNKHLDNLVRNFKALESTLAGDWSLDGDSHSGGDFGTGVDFIIEVIACQNASLLNDTTFWYAEAFFYQSFSHDFVH